MEKQNAVAAVELAGLPAAIDFADAALKSANIQLLGYELTKGGGQVTVKIAGDIGALRAAVQAGSASAARVGAVVGAVLLPRPARGMERILYSADTVGLPKKQPEQEPPMWEADSPAADQTPPSEPEPLPESKREASCNLCGDPACPRQKGEPRSGCIHGEKAEGDGLND